MITQSTARDASAAAALTANAEAATAAPAAPKPRRPYTLEQSLLLTEFKDAYGITPDQISFDGDSPDPIFHFDALMQLALSLTEIKEIGASPGDLNPTAGITTAESWVRTENNRLVRMFGTCLVGEVLYDDNRVEDIPSALDVARTRALRNVLRAIGFDPVRAHRETSSEFASVVKEADAQREIDLRQIHALAEEAGLVTNGDDKGYRDTIVLYFPKYANNPTSRHMNGAERAQLIGILRGIKSARQGSAETV